MSKPVNCGCGGEAEIFHIAPDGYAGSYCVRCINCLTQSPFFTGNKEKAIEVWNRAMGEQTAKVLNITHVRGYPPDGKCGNCGFDVIDDGEYCPGCGAKLDWSNYNE